MLAFELIAEQRIQEALARGAFDKLPGAGKPLEFDDDPLVPADVRMAMRVLKNAGVVPPEIALRKEIRALDAMILSLDPDDDDARNARRLAIRRLALLELQLEAMRGRQRPLRMCV